MDDVEKRAEYEELLERCGELEELIEFLVDTLDGMPAEVCIGEMVRIRQGAIDDLRELRAELFVCTRQREDLAAELDALID